MRTYKTKISVYDVELRGDKTAHADLILRCPEEREETSTPLGRRVYRGPDLKASEIEIESCELFLNLEPLGSYTPTEGETRVLRAAAIALLMRETGTGWEISDDSEDH